MPPRERRVTRGEPKETPPRRLGFLQLCADRRYHRKTGEEFEKAAKFNPTQYWIEAEAGGAPAFGTVTKTAQLAYDGGARVMGWAAHGTANDKHGCGAFPKVSDADMKAQLYAIAWRRFKDFPDCEHWVLFGVGGKVDAAKLF